MTKKLLLTALSCCMLNTGFAQLLLKGKVVDETERPIANASVRLENTSIGTVTNKDGVFELKNVPDGKYTLRASTMNFNASRLNIDSSNENIVMKLTYSYLNLNEVVVTGTGTHYRVKNTPIPTEVLTKREIENVGALTFEDALSALSPSIATKGSGITVGGLTNKNVLILVDGKKLSGDTGGNNDLSRIDMSNVKRIEVVKGGASSLYGSDAMGGVINIITKAPLNKIDVTTSRRFAEHGQTYESVNVGLKLGKFTSQSSYQYNKNKGWQLSNQEITNKGDLKDTQKQAVTAFKSDVASQKFTYSPNKALTVYAQGGFYQKKTDRVRSEYSYNMKYKDYNMAVGGTYRLKNKTDYIRFDTYFDNYTYGKDHFKGKKEGNYIMDKRQRYLNSTLKGVFKLGELNKLNVGLDFLNDYLKNPATLEQRYDRGSKSAYTFAVYAQDEFKWNRWTVIPGFRFIHHETFKNRFTPKVAVMYGLDHFNFRASYASGFRTPNMQELYSLKESGSMVSEGNKDLKPEKSNYYSINAEYMNDFISVSATGYINDVKDIIERTNVPLTPEEETAGLKDHYKYMNTSKARIMGFEFALTAYIYKGLTCGMGYTYMSPKNRDLNVRLYGTYRHAGTANVNWKKNWNNYDFNVNFNGRLQSNTYYPPSSNIYKDNIGRTYQLWNLATRHSFRGVRHFTPELGLGIENIFNFKDRKAFGHRYANTTPGRTFYASIILNFKK